jgi:hypothetical protein
VERAEARAGGYRPAAGGGAAASRADAALVRGIAWVGPGGEVWSSSGHSFLLPLGFGKGRDGGGLGISRAAPRDERVVLDAVGSSCLLGSEPMWQTVECGQGGSFFRVLWQAKIYL